MRLLDDAARKTFRTGLTLGLAVLLAACGRGGAEPLDVASASELPAATGAGAAVAGAQADYPQVLGEPFTVDGQLYTPEDVLSYDSVGYAGLDTAAGAGVTVAHKTLPLPSYVELTSLDSGVTILARVTVRGPMTSSRLVGLSPDAAAQLGVGEGGAVRVRRVNPLEQERAELRAGRSVPSRMEVPQSLLAVLRQNLPANGSASLRSAAAETTVADTTLASSSVPPVATSGLAQVDVPASQAASEPARPRPSPGGAPASALAQSFDRAMAEKPAGRRSYPLPPLPNVTVVSATFPQAPVAVAPAQPGPVVVAAASPAPATYSLPGRTTRSAATGSAPGQPAARSAIATDADGNYVVQAAAFADKGNAERAAGRLDGFVNKAGRYWRVRTGPYATRGQAEAALAKVRAAGYSDARVFTAG